MGTFFCSTLGGGGGTGTGPDFRNGGGSGPHSRLREVGLSVLYLAFLVWFIDYVRQVIASHVD